MTSGAVTLTLAGDGAPQQPAASLSTDPVCSKVLTQGSAASPPGSHHLVAVVDASALVLRLFVDGVACDGGGVHPSGWAYIW